MKMLFWKKIIFIFTIVIYTLFFLLLEYHYSGGLLNDDAYGYIENAEIAQQHGLRYLYQTPELIKHHTPPLLYFCILLLTKMLPVSIEAAGIICNWLAIILTAIGILTVSDLLYRDSVLAFGTTILIMGMPLWYKDASGILRDPLYWCEAICFLYLALCLNSIQDKFWQIYISLMLCGTLAGLMMLTRKEAITIVIPLFILSLVNLTDSWRIWRLPKKHIIPLITSIVLTGFIALLPWLCGIDFIPIYGIFDQLP